MVNDDAEDDDDLTDMHTRDYDSEESLVDTMSESDETEDMITHDEPLLQTNNPHRTSQKCKVYLPSFGDDLTIFRFFSVVDRRTTSSVTKA